MNKSAFLDYSTRNQSFLDMAMSSDIHKNNDFFLNLYDTSLQHVDPYDPDLTADQKIRIYNECSINPWYYLREVDRLYNSIDRPDFGSPFILTKANLAATICFINNIDFILELPSATCKTQSIISIISWAFMFGTLDTECMVMNAGTKHDQTRITELLVGKTKLLPNYIRQRIPWSRNCTEFSRSINNTTHGNYIEFVTPPRSFEKAATISRGFTAHIQFFNDSDYINELETKLNYSTPVYERVKTLARRNGDYSCRIFATISNGKRNDMMDRACPWRSSFYNNNIQHIKQVMDRNSSNGMMYIRFTYEELGYDEKWFTERCKMYNNDLEKINREILLKRE